MSFKSKRLRVQIPCQGESQVELPKVTIVTCRYPFSLPPTFCHFPSNRECVMESRQTTCVRFNSGFCPHGSNCGTPTEILTCLPGTRPICPGGSEFGGDPRERIQVEPDPENPGGVLIRPEDLPVLREHLQAELEGAEQLQEEVRDQLEEIKSIEGKLEEGKG